MENLEKVEIGEKVISNFNSIGLNDNNFNKVFLILLSKGDSLSVNDKKVEVKIEILDLR